MTEFFTNSLINFEIGVGPFTAVVTLRVRRPLPMDAFGLDSSSSDDDGSYERVVHARAAKKAAPAPRPPSPRAYVATARRSANQLQRPKRSAAEMLASITAKPRAAAAQARPERPLPPRAAPVRLPSSSRPSAAKRRRAPPTRSDPIVSESESSDDDSPQSRYLRDMLFFDPNKRAVEDARGRKVDAAAAAPSAAASASVLGRSDDDDDDDDERRHTSAAASAAHSVALKKEREKSEMDQLIAGLLKKKKAKTKARDNAAARPRGGSSPAPRLRKRRVRAPPAAKAAAGVAGTGAAATAASAAPARPNRFTQRRRRTAAAERSTATDADADAVAVQRVMGRLIASRDAEASAAAGATGEAAARAPRAKGATKKKAAPRRRGKVAGGEGAAASAASSAAAAAGGEEEESDDGDGDRPAFDDPRDPALNVRLELNEDGSYGVPAPLNKFLRPYQREGVKWLWKHFAEGGKGGGILGDDMGLGKTVQIIALLAAMYRKTNTERDKIELRHRQWRSAEDAAAQPTINPTLILCPASVVLQWKRELETWGYFSTCVMTQLKSDERAGALDQVRAHQYEIVLSSYTTMLNQKDAARGIKWSCVILDEAHKLKNAKSLNNIWVRRAMCH